MQKKINLKSKALKFLLIFQILAYLVVGVNYLSKKDLRGCQNLNTAEKLICWEKVIDSTLKRDGMNQAFEIVEKLYQEDPIFVSNCHDFVHLIGERTYKLFSENRQFNLSSKTSYCGYGFYHAFMESLLTDGGDLAKAREFCEYVDKKMQGQNADAKGACYHGIGHGVADNHDQKSWKNEDDLVDEALSLCEKVAPDNVLLNRCSSGVFNVLAIAYNGSKLKINSKDPLWFCRQQKNDIYKKTCYEEMNTALFVLTGRNFISAAKFIEAIEEDEFASSGIRSLAGVFGMSSVQNIDFAKNIDDCRNIQARLRLACFKGFVAGLMEGGNPGKEYEKALKFCKNSGLNIEEKEACIEELLRLCSLVDSKQQCWQNLMESTLNSQGLDQAFVLMDQLFKSERAFASDCHDFAHVLGEKAYQLFSINQQFNLPDKTSYCGYGFYHGFMEKLLHSKGSLDQARDFCKYAGEKLNQQNADAEGACYHGIGHGAVEDVTDPKLFGNPQTIIQPSLDLCEKVSDSEDKLFRCTTGVFNALEIVTSQGKYNLSLNKEDPLWVCRTQPNKNKRACYTQMVIAVMNVTKDDFAKSAKILDTIPEDDLAKESLSGLVVELVRLDRTDYGQTIIFCRKLGSRFHLACITGFGEGFLKYGPPQKEYVKGLDFCSANLLTDQEKSACFSRILPILRIWYTVEKAQQICKSVESKYQWNNCQYI